MTTIAIKDGVIAADSGVFQGGTWVGSVKKLIPVSVGDKTVAVIGWTGDLAGQSIIHDALSAGEDWRKGFDFDGIEGEAIILTSDGAVIFAEKKRRTTKIEAVCFAVGSGMDFALGAMSAGATAEEAVEIAAELDSGSRGPTEAIKVVK